MVSPWRCGISDGASCRQQSMVNRTTSGLSDSLVFDWRICDYAMSDTCLGVVWFIGGYIEKPLVNGIVLLTLRRDSTFLQGALRYSAGHDGGTHRGDAVSSPRVRRI